MSQALQRVVVRMMVDPAFCRRVFEGTALPELSAEEQGWLRASDPRAYGTDPHRRARLLQACIEELPAGSALLSRGGRELHRADAFFSSEAFHRSVQEREVLVLAYGTWLVDQVGQAAALELATARARRRPHLRGQGLCLRPRAWTVSLSEGGVQRWQALRQRLGAEPLGSLVEGTIQTRRLPREGGAPWPCLVTVNEAGEAGLEVLPPALFDLLEAALEVRSQAWLLAKVQTAGATAEEAREIVDELLSDGLLVQSRDP